MKTKLLFLICIISCPFAYGQEKDLHIVATAGSTFHINDLSLDWTIGEVIVDFYEGSTYSVTQGFHQPSYRLVSVKSIPSELGSISVFPNPFSEELIVEMTFAGFEKGNIELLDLKGTSIWKKPFEGREIHEQYITSTLPSGMYLMVITLAHNGLVQSYHLAKPQ